MSERLKIVRVAPSVLTPAEFNPRRISTGRFEALKRSLAEDAEMMEARPLIARPNGTVLCGNMRLRAALELGLPEVPVVYADLDEDRARLWMLRDNNEYGEWDEDALAELIYELRVGGADLELTGFPEEELARLLDLSGANGDVGDADEAPPRPAEPDSRPGETYRLGPHVLVCGDATDPAVVQAACEGAAAEPRDALTIENDGAESLPALLACTFAAVDTVLADAGRFYVAAPAGPRGTDFRLAIRDAGWTFHQALVWVKDTMVLGHSGYHHRHEDVLYGWKPGTGRVGRGRCRAHAGAATTLRHPWSRSLAQSAPRSTRP